MKFRKKCGHKAGPDCVICNKPEDLGDTEMAQHAALVFQLIDLAPTLMALQMAGSEEAAVSLFTRALGFDEGGAPPDAGVVNRLCKLVVVATNTAAQMWRLVDTRDEITLRPPPPHWTEKHLLAARMLVAAANNDPGYVADLLVAGIAGKDPFQQIDCLSNVLYLQVTAAWKGRETAKVRAKS